MAEHIDVTPDPAVALEVREHQLTMLLATMAFLASDLRKQPDDTAVFAHDVAQALDDMIGNAGLDGTLKEIEMLDFEEEDDE